MKKKIIKIDEEKCVGCGACANACKQSAIDIVDGKAKIVRQNMCDGLGFCLPVCPMNAISFIEEEIQEKKENACGCSGTKPQTIIKEENSNKECNIEIKSQLMQWPCQIKLLPISAPYYENVDLLIASDCTAYSYGNFHNDFMKGKITAIGCPKLDSIDYSDKLAEIIKENSIQSITITRMEVPCCGGMEIMVKSAIEKSGKNIECKVITIGINGNIK